MKVVIRKRLRPKITAALKATVSPAYINAATDEEVSSTFKEQYEAVFGAGSWVEEDEEEEENGE